jgi:hypothetical protein
VPFRNSKLTQLLQDSLCGQAKASGTGAARAQAHVVLVYRLSLARGMLCELKELYQLGQARWRCKGVVVDTHKNAHAHVMAADAC